MKIEKFTGDNIVSMQDKLVSAYPPNADMMLQHKKRR